MRWRRHQTDSERTARLVDDGHATSARDRDLGPQPAIQMRDVDAHRHSNLALQSVNLTIEPGTVTAVIGPNGAGKSTMFGLISGRFHNLRESLHADTVVALACRCVCCAPPRTAMADPNVTALFDSSALAPM